MSYLGDTLTVSLILVLLFGSIALYLYTRVQQTEQKVSLLESIVLDLKLTGEIQPFNDLPDHLHHDLSPVSPASPVSSSSSSSSLFSDEKSVLPPVKEEYIPFKDTEDVEEEEAIAVAASEPQPESQLEDASIEFLPLDEPQSSTITYDGMSLKELQGLVRSRGLTMEKGAKKHILLEQLKQYDAEHVNEVKPGSMSSSTILESFSGDE